MMRQQATRDLYSYWNSIRRQRAAPDRAEIDPAAIRAILANTFMIETDVDGRFPIRLSGSRLNALFLRELKGESFLELWGADRGNIAAALWTVMDGAAPIVAGVKAAPLGRPPLDLELLLLPLRHHGKTHARILGALSSNSHAEWLGLLPVDRLELRSLRIMTAAEAQVNLPVVSWPTGARERRASGRPYLQLVEGGLEGR